MQSAASGRGSTTTDRIDAFEAMRDEALESLLADVLALRQADTDPSEYENLDLRAETMGSDEERQASYGGLRWFVGAYAEAEALHTLTAFSLPAGRNPAGDDIWVFIAFDGLEGFLVQRSIEIISPSRGKTLADLGTHETVASAAADDRVMDIIEAGGRDSAELRQQVLISPSDRARLGDRINDPAQTLVPNTSCATCHSFNDLTFNFHNLSYLQEMEISVAPRVKNDVKHDLGWLRADPW